MRRASTCLAVLGLAALALAGTASAAPTVTFKAKAVPIAGYPNTGNILGHGAALQSEFTISGTEYGGFPAPLVGVYVALPTGSKIHSQGFKTCPVSVLEQEGAQACNKKKAAAGPVGHALGVVSFGTERVPEETSISSFFAPGGGLEFLAHGVTPVELEIISSGKYVSLNGGGGFGPELKTQVPLVVTVPGAPDASVERISVKVGAAYKSHGKPVYYGTMPKKCPKGGFPLRAELLFAPNAQATLPGTPLETVTTVYKAPCPRK
ncbi:MAG: hypothetical protein ACRDJX_06640 [Solirubrobacteraceae bacterium]